jgi:putative flavoprotein involved in K+ transport
VRPHTTVTSVRPNEDGYEVVTDRGTWHCRTVVIATGACNIANVPAIAEAMPRHIRQVTPKEYRNPEQLEEGGVLVVGASASGAQIADEIHRSGRPVTLSVGEHIRVPRMYRGRDIEWWMDAAGIMDDFYRDADNLDRVRTVPSLQLTGSDDRHDLDLNSLTEIGVQLVGRIAGVTDGKAQFSGSLANQAALSDLKMGRLLDRIDEWATEKGLDDEVDPPHRFEATRVEASPPLGISLHNGAIRTIVWATGYRPDHSWLDAPVFDRKSRIRHDGGVLEAPGMYLLGMPFLRRRKSSLIDGAGDDARELSAHLDAYLAGNGTRRSA